MAEGKQLSEESRKALTECLKFYDRSGNGCIDGAELKPALQFAGIWGSDDQYQEVKKLFDKNEDETLQIEEIVNNWEALTEHSVNGNEMLEAFKKFDKNDDGYIKLEELKSILGMRGEKWNQDEISGLMKYLSKFDKEGDGKFSYIEFITMYKADICPFKKPEEYEKTPINQRYDMYTKEDTPAAE